METAFQQTSYFEVSGLAISEKKIKQKNTHFEKSHDAKIVKGPVGLFENPLCCEMEGRTIWRH